MKLPRDLSGDDLIKSLRRYGYVVTRQVGSHARLTTQQGGEHSITIPRHSWLRVGTLNNILRDVAEHFGMDGAALAQDLFGR